MNLVRSTHPGNEIPSEVRGGGGPMNAATKLDTATARRADALILCDLCGRLFRPTRRLLNHAARKHADVRTIPLTVGTRAQWRARGKLGPGRGRAA